MNMLLNILWFVLGGFLIFFGYVLGGILLCITIIGIPFAWAHFKLAALALWPIGMTIVPYDFIPQPYPRRD